LDPLGDVSENHHLCDSSFETTGQRHAAMHLLPILSRMK